MAATDLQRLSHRAEEQRPDCGSRSVAVAHRDEDLGRLAQSNDWAVIEPGPHDWVWTDNYSNFIGAMIRHLHK